MQENLTSEEKILKHSLLLFRKQSEKKKKKDFYRNDAFSENQGLIRKTYATFGETERSLSL